MDCRTSILSLLPSREECFFDLSHFFKYSLVLSIKENSFPMDKFTYVETKDPSFDFVVGFEGKGFVKEVEKDCVKLGKDLRKCLGFDYLFSEEYKVEEGKRIYYPDLTVEVLRVLKDERDVDDFLEEELKNYEAKDYATSEGVERFVNPYLEFTSTLRDKDLEELSLLSSVYSLANNVRDRAIEENEELERVYRQIENKIISIASKYNVELRKGKPIKYEMEERISEDEEHVEEEMREPIDVTALLVKVRAIKVRERMEEFKEFVKSKNKEQEVKLGKYSVSFHGVLLDKFEDKNVTVLSMGKGMKLKMGSHEFELRLQKPTVLLLKSSRGRYEVVI
ncbi:MAG: hypothetical protein ASUL_07724 [Candidatus Aramenus sulfurataquae]|uniref:Uncharacterized protein n=1 Tax=Candidatus Aramenus sulfurataquae TaxID=1326980 RepID=W7KKT7_9CREN|nr:MAG: hypothetical protein ASUL_07724 [Candidatus Aramenus sulfurataquae]